MTDGRPLGKGWSRAYTGDRSGPDRDVTGPTVRRRQVLMAAGAVALMAALVVSSPQGKGRLFGTDRADRPAVSSAALERAVPTGRWVERDGTGTLRNIDGTCRSTVELPAAVRVVTGDDGICALATLASLGPVETGADGTVRVVVDATALGDAFDGWVHDQLTVGLGRHPTRAEIAEFDPDRRRLVTGTDEIIVDAQPGQLAVHTTGAGARTVTLEPAR